MMEIRFKPQVPSGFLNGLWVVQALRLTFKAAFITCYVQQSSLDHKEKHNWVSGWVFTKKKKMKIFHSISIFKEKLIIFFQFVKRRSIPK